MIPITETNNALNETNLKMSIYSNLLDVISEEKAINDPDRNEAINQINQLLPTTRDTSGIFLYLGYAIGVLLILLIICGSINIFRQQRLSGFYDFKRELIKEKNKCTDKSTDPS